MEAEPTPPQTTVRERRFRAMGSDAHLIVVGGASELIEQAEERVAALEARWSRFRPDSEISTLNRLAGQAVPVTADTILLVERAIEAWRLTGGGFDPTVLGAVVRAGYDRSFEEIGPVARPGSSTLLLGCTDIVVRAGTVTLPAGIGFDPGGIGKGLAADLVATETMAAGAGGVCINLGGDLRVAGTGPDGGAWTIAIEHPWVADAVTLVGVAAGAVATSTTLRRAWSIGGAPHHHLIDPATGEPSATDLNQATVIAAEAWMAEVLAKAVLLRGAERAFDLFDAARTAALVVGADGHITATAGFTAFGVVPSEPLAAPVAV